MKIERKFSSFCFVLFFFPVINILLSNLFFPFVSPEHACTDDLLILKRDQLTLTVAHFHVRAIELQRRLNRTYLRLNRFRTRTMRLVFAVENGLVRPHEWL